MSCVARRVKGKSLKFQALFVTDDLLQQPNENLGLIEQLCYGRPDSTFEVSMKFLAPIVVVFLIQNSANASAFQESCSTAILNALGENDANGSELDSEFRGFYHCSVLSKAAAEKFYKTKNILVAVGAGAVTLLTVRTERTTIHKEVVKSCAAIEKANQKLATELADEPSCQGLQETLFKMGDLSEKITSATADCYQDGWPSAGYLKMSEVVAFEVDRVAHDALNRCKP